jgi:hypothetical protein
MRITNPKIEKRRAEIAKTKAKIAEFQAKQREQEKQLRQLEDMEIVAMFRSERIGDEHLETLRESEPDAQQTRADTAVSAEFDKEATANAYNEN